MAKSFNPNILTMARGARGISQSALAEKMEWSQGKASKVEHGMSPVSLGEAQEIAAFLEYPCDLFYQSDSSSGFGSCCLYHRKRLTTPVKVLNRLHDEINIRRIQMAHLLRGVTLPHELNIPRLDIDEYKMPEVVAQSLRASWHLPRGPIVNLVDAIEAAGGIVVLCDLHTPKIDAVSHRSMGLPPILFLDRDKPTDRCRFTLAHELGHFVMHTTPTPDAEREADRFAAEILDA